MTDNKPTNKSKLTLSVDKEIVNKAKDLGLNLSEITESVLRSFTFTPSKTDRESIYEAYKGMFDIMLPLLKEYDTYVIVAKTTDIQNDNTFLELEWELLADGTLWNSDFEVEYKEITSIPTYAFLEPPKILFNFITSLANAKERRNEKLEQIELAKRILSAIIDSEPRKGTKKASTDKEEDRNGN